MIFEKSVTSQKTWILRFDVSDDRDAACLLNTGTLSDAAGNPRWFWCIYWLWNATQGSKSLRMVL